MALLLEILGSRRFNPKLIPLVLLNLHISSERI